MIQCLRHLVSVVCVLYSWFSHTAPIAGPVGQGLGYRPAVMLGGAMASAGFIAASRASDVPQLALPLHLLTGDQAE